MLATIVELQDVDNAHKVYVLSIASHEAVHTTLLGLERRVRVIGCVIAVVATEWTVIQLLVVGNASRVVMYNDGANEYIACESRSECFDESSRGALFHIHVILAVGLIHRIASARGPRCGSSSSGGGGCRRCGLRYNLIIERYDLVDAKQQAIIDDIQRLEKLQAPVESGCGSRVARIFATHTSESCVN